MKTRLVCNIRNVKKPIKGLIFGKRIVNDELSISISKHQYLNIRNMCSIYAVINNEEFVITDGKSYDELLKKYNESLENLQTHVKDAIDETIKEGLIITPSDLEAVLSKYDIDTDPTKIPAVTKINTDNIIKANTECDNVCEASLDNNCVHSDRVILSAASATDIINNIEHSPIQETVIHADVNHEEPDSELEENDNEEEYITEPIIDGDTTVGVKYRPNNRRKNKKRS